MVIPSITFRTLVEVPDYPLNFDVLLEVPLA